MACDLTQRSQAHYWTGSCLNPRYQSQTRTSRPPDQQAQRHPGHYTAWVPGHWASQCRIRPYSRLPGKDARSTSLPEQDNNPSRLVNKYLDSVADHKIREYATEDKRAPRLRGRRAWESGRQNSARECRFQERLSPVTYVTHTYGKWFVPVGGVHAVLRNAGM
jgi:hypothetical protein